MPGELSACLRGEASAALVEALLESLSFGSSGAEVQLDWILCEWAFAWTRNFLMNVLARKQTLWVLVAAMSDSCTLH